jgi:hypothetical protein
MNKKIRSEYISAEIKKMLDDSNPKFSMMLIAQEIVKNCFAQKYQFRNVPMFHRLSKHGVLPKSFFRQNFQRCSKLLELIKITGYTLDSLTDEIAKGDLLEQVNIFERKESKEFYKLVTRDECQGG